MGLEELNQDQLFELKQSILCDRYEWAGKSVSMGELLAADELVSDDEVRMVYGGTIFTEDDFFCSAGMDCA